MPWMRGPCRCGFGPHAWIWYPEERPWWPKPGWMPREDERKMLESYAEDMERELERIRKRIEELKGKK